MIKDKKTVYDEMTGECCNIVTLDNGLHVYHIPSKHITSHALFGVDYGSVHRIYQKNGSQIITPSGCAHFLEHKLFDNPDGVADDIFTSLGASCNAFTSSSVTAYTFSCTDNFLPCLDTLLDFVSTPYFTEASVKKECGIIAEEIRMYDDMPSWCAYFNMLKAMYGQCPISEDTAGSCESITHITPELLYELHRDMYTLDNMHLCVYADSPLEQILMRADRLRSPKCQITQIPPQTKPGIFQARKEHISQSPVPLVFIGLKDDDVPKNGAEATKRECIMSCLLNTLFSESSDIFEELYSSSLIIGRLDCEYICEKDFAYLYFSCESPAPEELFKHLSEYCERICAEGIDKERYEISKRMVYADFIRSFDSRDDLPYCMYRERENIFDHPAMISSSSVETAHELFKKLFKTENLVMSVSHS